MEKEKEIYCVFVEGKTVNNNPSVAHDSYEDALEEAKRLAVKECQKVYVMQATAIITILEPKVTVIGE